MIYRAKLGVPEQLDNLWTSVNVLTVGWPRRNIYHLCIDDNDSITITTLCQYLYKLAYKSPGIPAIQLT